MTAVTHIPLDLLCLIFPWIVFQFFFDVLIDNIFLAFSKIFLIGRHGLKKFQLFFPLIILGAF